MLTQICFGAVLSRCGLGESILEKNDCYRVNRRF